MRLNPDHDLSPASVEMLRDLLVSQPREPEATDEELLRFAVGSLSEAEEAELVSWLVNSPTGRDRLVAHLEAVDRARGLPFDQIKESPVRQFLAEAIRRTLNSSQEALASALRTLALSQRTPRFASVRSGTTFDIRAEIDPNGTLRIDAPGLEAVRLLDPGGGEFVFDAGEETVEVPGVGTRGGLPQGPLPDDFFTGTDLIPSPPVVYIEDGAFAFSVEIVEPPRLQDGVLAFALGPFFRPASGWLEISLPSGNAEQILFREPIDAWDQEPQRIEIQLPIAGGEELATLSLLIFRLVGNTGPTI